MNIKLFAFFSCISLVLCNAGIYRSWAKAPDSAKIVFASNRSGNLDIYLMNPDGNEVVKLTDNPAEDYAPVFSPIGEQILFVSHRDGIRDLYVMDADGRNQEKVFSSTIDRTDPAWSPDGKQIVYFRYKDATLCTAKINGKDETPIAKTGTFGGDPAWSPDGKTIVFTFWSRSEKPQNSTRWISTHFHLTTGQQAAESVSRRYAAYLPSMVSRREVDCLCRFSMGSP